ncbi:MAG: sugar phosphate isomerase/epimerase, partial [Acidobacteria bacterium]
AVGFWAVAKAAGPPQIAFNTANLVARVTGYRYELRNWMTQHIKTAEATDAAAWRAICQEIAATGFKAVEVWEAHASPEKLDRAKALEWKKILDGAGLKAVAYAGRLSPKTAEICQVLGIPHIDGGLGTLSPEQATALCKETGIRCNIENHPEKSADELKKKIGAGNEWLGVCIDTGWLGTQGVSGPDVIKACGSLVRHTHIKDVKKAGAHETCPLGEGVANVEGCLKALQAINYQGAYSWEDEPEDRNPFDSAKRNLAWIAARV